jgi:hypothetical protein
MSKTGFALALQRRCKRLRFEWWWFVSCSDSSSPVHRLVDWTLDLLFGREIEQMITLRFSDLLFHDDRRLRRTYRVPPGHRGSDMKVSRSSEITATPKSSFNRSLRVFYPPGTGTLVIRTQLDWGRDILRCD